MSYTLPDRMSEIMSEYIVHQGGNHSRNFHFAIPRIKEDDLDKIIVVQNSGGPNTCSFGVGIHAHRHTWWNCVVRISIPRFSRY